MTKRLAFALFFLTCILGCKHNPTDVDPKGDETAKACRLRVFTSTNVDYAGKTLTTYSMRYDAQGRLIGSQRVITAPNSVTLSTFSDSHEYDANGYVVKRTFAGMYDTGRVAFDGSWLLSYDPSGRISEINEAKNNDLILGGVKADRALSTNKMTYAYDAAGKLKTYTQVYTTIPSDKSKPAQTQRSETSFTNGIITKFATVRLGGTVAEEPYEFNAQGLAVSQNINGRLFSRYSYDERGNMTKAEYFSGYANMDRLIYTFEYDDKPRLSIPPNIYIEPILGGLVYGGAKGHPNFVPVGSLNASPNNLVKETITDISAGGQPSTVYTKTYTNTYNAKGFLTGTTMTYLETPDYFKQDRYEYVDCQ